MTVAAPRVSLVILILLNLFRAPAWAQAPTGLSINIVEGEGAINNIRQRVNREPRLIDADHFNHSRNHAAHCAASDVGRLTVIDCWPRRTSTRISL